MKSTSNRMQQLSTTMAQVALILDKMLDSLLSKQMMYSLVLRRNSKVSSSEHQFQDTQALTRESKLTIFLE